MRLRRRARSNADKTIARVQRMIRETLLDTRIEGWKLTKSGDDLNLFSKRWLDPAGRG